MRVSLFDKLFFKKRKTALVLSGGSARGLAHVGVMKVLRREGFQFDCVVGTSIGALSAAAYALDIPLDSLERFALKTGAGDLIDLTISRMGLTEGNKLEAVICTVVANKTFDDVKVPLAITAVDIETGEGIYFTKGDLVKAIKASCSLPGIFKPVEYQNRLLSDGGLRQHLPVDIARKMGADCIVAVDVGFCVRKGRITNMLGVIMQSIQIMGEEMSRFQSGKADILIAPKLGETVDQLAFNRAPFIIEQGRQAAEEALPLLRKFVRRRR